jgi:hypothetical protein
MVSLAWQEVSQKTYLGEALLLEVSDDALAKQVGGSDDVQHLFMVIPEQSQLETVLSRVEGDGFRAGGTVEAVDGLALDTGEVDRVVEGADNAMVTKSDLA